MKDVIINDEEVIGRVQNVVEYIKDNMIDVIKKIDLFDVDSSSESVEEIMQNNNIWLELLNGLYQDVITDYLDYDDIIRVYYNHMGAYMYEKYVKESEVKE